MAAPDGRGDSSRIETPLPRRFSAALRNVDRCFRAGSSPARDVASLTCAKCLRHYLAAPGSEVSLPVLLRTPFLKARAYLGFNCALAGAGGRSLA